MKTIDFRFRPNTDAILKGMKALFPDACAATGFDARIAQTLPEIVETLDSLEVEIAVITGRDAESTHGLKSNNQSVLDFCKEFPNKFVGFWGIDPHKKMAAVYDTIKAIEEYGMKGISIDPYLAQIPACEARFYPLYAKCVELDVPVFVTMAPPPQTTNAIMDYCDPRHVDQVARDFPELTLIMSHGGYPYVNEAIFACWRNKNVYMDFSEYETSPMHDVFVDGMKGMIQDKVIFASAHPFIDLKDALKNYENFDLTDEVRKKVMYENAARILKIK